MSAQLSPGPLVDAHKDLEGITKCTQCHDIGNKVSNDKCLNCHKEIKTLTDRNRGFHASGEVKGKDCAQCHSDHHGRNFDMLRFDEKKFNHRLTNYELTGAHKQIDCRKCHLPDLIADQEIKYRKGTFLGLDTKCNACHKDVHRKTLGNDCAKCHSTDDFVPASRFNHDKTDFVLAGKHKAVQCTECHQKETIQGEVFQKFDGIPFKNCQNCHKDPHNNQLGANCKECHNEQTFAGWPTLSRFNHNQTHFPLKGKHKQVNCQECHKMSATPLTVFQDRPGVKTENCQSCHKDVHEGALGTDCAACHTEDSFRKLGNPDRFDHDKTHFALEGKHETVDCKKCHTAERMTDPVAHNRCADCHSDYHEGQFTNGTHQQDCGMCHTVGGFGESSFGIELHAITLFPLEGGHAATPCFACHKQGEKWKFRNVGRRCVDCHQDVHAGQIAAKWYPDKACERCHQVSGWQDNHFEHQLTAFALKGAHTRQSCRSCHIPDETHPNGRFAGIGSQCADCHADVHRGQFVQNNTVQCERCHQTEHWEIRGFNHNKTAFKLDGKHINVACSGCHKTIDQNGEAFIQYKFDSFECVVCHR